jgi:E3 Ubiquitin Ligase RBR C-terminal domain
LFHCSAKHGAVVTPWPTSTYFNFTSFRIQIASLYNDPIGKCPEFEQISAQFRQRQFRLVPPFESIVIDFFSFFQATNIEFQTESTSNSPITGTQSIEVSNAADETAAGDGTDMAEGGMVEGSASSGKKGNIKCRVQLQKETPVGLVDDICGNEVENGHAGLCRFILFHFLFINLILKQIQKRQNSWNKTQMFQSFLNRIFWRQLAVISVDWNTH